MHTEGQVKDVSFRLGWMSSQPEDQRKNRFQKMDDAPVSAGQRGGVSPLPGSCCVHYCMSVDPCVAMPSLV